MKVKQLIKELKKMPPNLEVSVAIHDNHEYEIAGDVFSVFHFIKEEFYDIVIESNGYRAQEDFEDMPEECVILRC